MKKHGLLILLLICVLCLAACGQATPSDTSTSSVLQSTDESVSTTTASASTTESSASEPGATQKADATNQQTSSSKQQSTTTTTTKKTSKAVSQLKYSPNIKGLPGTKSKELMKNPERGYYMEVNMNVATGKTMAGDKDAIAYLREQIGYYANETPQLTQNYFYLTGYSDRDLDQAAFDKMQKYFDVLRENNIQACVRFAYEYDEGNNVVGPTTDQMLRHMKQLKVFLENNKDTIHVIQAGFIGLWGEWHHSVHSHDYKRVLEGIVDMTPAGKFVQVRLASYKNVLDENDPRRDRVSYHDDYLVGEDHHWSSAHPDNAMLYQMMLNDSSSMLVAGEMPWGSDKYHNNGVIDGLGMAKHLQKFHYTALSITHNYIESGIYSSYNMNQWKSIEVTEATLKANGLRYAESWLKDENGAPTTRSVFAYIRDYLGYYIEASDVQASVSGNTVKTTLKLKNYGFSAPHGMKSIELVLTDASGKVLSSSKSLCAMNDLQPGESVSVQADLSAASLQAGYQVGIRFVNDRGLTARLANDVAYTNGINVLFALK